MTNGYSRYLKQKRLHHGLCSEVYLAHDLTLTTAVTGPVTTTANDNDTDTAVERNANFVVLKITIPEEDYPPHDSRKELEVLSQKLKQSANTKPVISLLDSFNIGEELIMVLPYYEYNLREYLQKHTKKRIDLFNVGNMTKLQKNKLPTEEISKFITDIMEAVEFIHANGIIHRDLKLDNILINQQDHRAVVTDFGICWNEPDNYGKEPASDKIIDIGTGIYKAPEIIFGLTSYTNKSDIWCIGVMMTELYSQDGISILDKTQTIDISDLTLLSNIIDVFGTAEMSNWVEVSHKETFQAFKFHDIKGAPLDEIIPRCDDSLMRKMFNAMMKYESSQRISAAEFMRQFHVL